MRTLTFTVGAPGSGKSTWAQKQEGPRTLLLERDRFRKAIFGSRLNYWDQTEISPERYNEVSHLLGSTIYGALANSIKNGYHDDWIISDTGAKFNSVKRFLQLGKHHGLQINVERFLVPWSVIEKRDDVRRQTADHVQREFLENSFKQVNNPNGWWNDKGLVDQITYRNEFGEEI